MARLVPVMRSLRSRSVTLWGIFRNRIFPCKHALSPSIPRCHLETTYNDVAFSEEPSSQSSQPSSDLIVPARPYRYNRPLANRSEHGHIATENATGFSSSDFENSMDNHSVVTSHKLQDILYDLPPPKRSRPRPLSRSLVVAWKHVSANLRLQESHVEEMEYVTSNFIIVDSTSFSMSTHSLPLHPDCNNPISRSTPRPRSYNRSESFLELVD